MLQVCLDGAEMLPGRDKLIHLTGDLRRSMPNNLWWVAHLRTDVRRWSRCTQSVMSGGRIREDVGQVNRWVPSRGVVPSQGQGGGVEVPMLSPGVQPLFDLRRNNTEDSSRVRERCILMCRRGGRVYSCATLENHASHSVEMAVDKCRVR